MRTKEENLNEMNDHDGEHEVGSPVMNRANIPAERLMVVQIFQTRISFISGRDIHKSQTNSGSDLDNEAKQSAAAENIKPAARICRDHMTRSGLKQLADVQPF